MLWNAVESSTCSHEHSNANLNGRHNENKVSFLAKAQAHWSAMTTIG